MPTDLPKKKDKGKHKPDIEFLVFKDTIDDFIDGVMMVVVGGIVYFVATALAVLTDFPQEKLLAFRIGALLFLASGYLLLRKSRPR